MRPSPYERWVGFAATSVAALYVWFTMGAVSFRIRVGEWWGLLPFRIRSTPSLLLKNTITNGGDTGAHVWWPAYLRDHILPKWRLTGWSPDWYAGFPAGHFYFPLPSLAVVVLDVFLPYNVAFKLVSAIGPVMLPVAAYFFARGIGARWPAPPLFAVATLPFLFYTGYTIWGGNLASNLAGEFSFSIALVLGLFFLGSLARALDERSGLVAPAALLAATVMSHLIVAVFVAVGAIVIWLQRRPMRNLPVAAAIGAVGALVTAIWSVPLVMRLGYTTDMGWTKELPFGPHRNLLPTDLRWAFLLAGLGAVVGLVARRRATIGLLALATIFGVAFVVMPEARLWNARLMPFYYLMVLFLAATAVAEMVDGLVRAVRSAASRPARPTSPAVSRGVPELTPVDPSIAPASDPALVEPSPPAPFTVPVEAVRAGEPVGRTSGVLAWVASSLVVAVALGSAIVYTDKTHNFLPAWIKWNYNGYEAKPAYGEFRDVIDTMAKLPPGRALWEPSSGIDKYGTTLALELLPHFTDGRIGSMEGLYFESAATTPYHFMVVSALAKSPSNPVKDLKYRTLADFDLGVAQMRLLGVRYYMAQSDEAKAKADASDGLRFLTETGAPGVTPLVARWRIYEVLDAPLVEPLRNEPVVLDGVSHKEWLTPSAAWFDDASALDRPLVDSGPAGWAHGDADSARLNERKPLPAVTVSNIESGDDTVSFDVSQPGVPVLVKTSYFPNWKVSGAKGPYRATPNLMVVVPTATHVSLEYGRTGVDWAGMLLTVVGLAGLAALARWQLVPLAPVPPRRRRRPAEAGFPPPEPYGPPSPPSGDPSEEESAPALA